MGKGEVARVKVRGGRVAPCERGPCMVDYAKRDMTRSDQFLEVVKASLAGDTDAVRRIAQATAADSRRRQHHALAERLEALLESPRRKPVQHRFETADDLTIEEFPRRGLDELVLQPRVRDAVTLFVQEQLRSELLRSFGMEPRSRVLLSGPPGNGKTSLAAAISAELAIPLLTIRYDAVITSFLGDTASRLARVFEYARYRQCVLLFDEFDSVGKERADLHETGEIKRVVSSLLLQIDRLPSYVIVVAATNHKELLDRAVWRRFQLRLDLPQPTLVERLAFVQRLSFGEPLVRKFEKRIATALKGASYAELEEFLLDIRRRTILFGTEQDMDEIFRQRLMEWRTRVSPEAADNAG